MIYMHKNFNWEINLIVNSLYFLLCLVSDAVQWLVSSCCIWYGQIPRSVCRLFYPTRVRSTEQNKECSTIVTEQVFIKSLWHTDFLCRPMLQHHVKKNAKPCPRCRLVFQETFSQQFKQNHWGKMLQPSHLSASETLKSKEKKKVSNWK